MNMDMIKGAVQKIEMSDEMRQRILQNHYSAAAARKKQKQFFYYGGTVAAALILLSVVLIINPHWRNACDPSGLLLPDNTSTAAPATQAPDTQTPATQTPGPSASPSQAPTGTSEPTQTPAPTTPTPVITLEIPQGATRFSEEVLEMFNSEFFSNEDSLHDWNTRFLTSLYDAPEDIDLYELFYIGVSQSNALSEAERQQIQEAGGDLRLDVSKATVEQMDAILKAYTGISLEDTKKVGLDRFIYLSDYQAYYHVSGDINFYDYTILDGYSTQDGIYVLFYNLETNEGVASTEPYAIVTLKKEGDRYLFVSNQVYEGTDA